MLSTSNIIIMFHIHFKYFCMAHLSSTTMDVLTHEVLYGYVNRNCCTSSSSRKILLIFSPNIEDYKYTFLHMTTPPPPPPAHIIHHPLITVEFVITRLCHKLEPERSRGTIVNELKSTAMSSNFHLLLTNIFTHFPNFWCNIPPAGTSRQSL